MSINKLIVLGAAFMLASLLGSVPVSAVTCPDPINFPNDADCDGIVDAIDTCNNLQDPIGCADDDGDGILNNADECPDTNVAALGLDLVIDTCTATGVIDTLFTNGCSLSDVVMECADGAKNHGKFVSCVAHVTNGLKKAKVISGAQKVKIQSCAAHSDIGKKSKP